MLPAISEEPSPAASNEPATSNDSLGIFLSLMRRFYRSTNSGMRQHWNKMTIEQKGRWLTGQLWNCTDVLPRNLCDDLEIYRGSTYAMAVRKLSAFQSSLLSQLNGPSR